MELRFQPSLIQEVIDAFIEKTEREGDPTFYKEFHELADPIYENFPLDDREPEFQKRSEEHTSELQSLAYLVCRLLLEKKKRRPCRVTPCPLRTSPATQP